MSYRDTTSTMTTVRPSAASALMPAGQEFFQQVVGATASYVERCLSG
jgi:hypothetical protein